MKLHPNPIPSSLFTVMKERKWLIAEHSSLCNVQLMNKLYDDACDVGIALVNSKTGNITRWYLDKQRFERGELVAWVFKPCTKTIGKNLATVGWQVHVLND